MPIDSSNNIETRGRLVWDLPTRLFHWLLVLTICAQYATGEAGDSWLVWHFRLGYFMMGLLTFRIIWGFVGPTHARFSNFVKGPGSALAYLPQLRKTGQDAIHSVGHNPLGGLMVIAMLALLGAQVVTGLFSSDGLAYYGPYSSIVSSSTSDQITDWHGILIYIIIAAAALHILAVLFYTFVKKSPLVPAMIHGRKPQAQVPADEGIEHSALVRAVIVAIIAVGVVFLVQHEAPPSTTSASAVTENQ
jgi:cytochrome b